MNTDHVEGVLEVGTNERHEVVVSLPPGVTAELEDLADEED